MRAKAIIVEGWGNSKGGEQRLTVSQGDHMWVRKVWSSRPVLRKRLPLPHAIALRGWSVAPPADRDAKGIMMLLNPHGSLIVRA